MKRNTGIGKIEEIYYVQLNKGEDILEAIFDICQEHDIKTGLVLDGNGAVDKFVYQKFPETPEYCPYDVAITTLDGPCEVRLSGTIGTMYCEDVDKCVSFPKTLATVPGILDTMQDKWECIGASGPMGTYFHGHIVVTDKNHHTVCGHLMKGTHVHVTKNSGVENVPSHFTIVIAKVSGIELRCVSDEIGYYHQLIDTSKE